MRLEKEGGLKLGNAQFAMQRSWNFNLGTKGRFISVGLPWVDPCRHIFTIKNTVSWTSLSWIFFLK